MENCVCFCSFFVEKQWKMRNMFFRQCGKGVENRAFSPFFHTAMGVARRFLSHKTAKYPRNKRKTPPLKERRCAVFRMLYIKINFLCAAERTAFSSARFAGALIYKRSIIAFIEMSKNSDEKCTALQRDISAMSSGKSLGKEKPCIITGMTFFPHSSA